MLQFYISCSNQKFIITGRYFVLVKSIILIIFYCLFSFNIFSQNKIQELLFSKLTSYTILDTEIYFPAHDTCVNITDIKDSFLDNSQNLIIEFPGYIPKEISFQELQFDSIIILKNLLEIDFYRREISRRRIKAKTDSIMKNVHYHCLNQEPYYVKPDNVQGAYRNCTSELLIIEENRFYKMVYDDKRLRIDIYAYSKSNDRIIGNLISSFYWNEKDEELEFNSNILQVEKEIEVCILVNDCINNDDLSMLILSMFCERNINIDNETEKILQKVRNY